MTNLDIFSVKGKKIIITGGGRGLGFEIANYFQDNGAEVIVFDKTFKNRFHNKKIKKIKCNFLNKKKTITSINELLAKNKINVLINCAAVTIPNVKNISNSIKNWEKTININLTIPYLFCKLVGKDMIKKKIKGRIINFSSIGAEVGFPNNNSYGPSKSGLKQLSKTLANDWGRYGINVNTIIPGYFSTEMNKSSWMNKKKK